MIQRILVTIIGVQYVHRTDWCPHIMILKCRFMVHKYSNIRLQPLRLTNEAVENAQACGPAHISDSPINF